MKFGADENNANFMIYSVTVFAERSEEIINLLSS